MKSDTNSRIGEITYRVSASLGQYKGKSYFEHLVRNIVKELQLKCGFAYELLEDADRPYQLLAEWVEEKSSDSEHKQLDESTIRALHIENAHCTKHEDVNELVTDDFINTFQLKSLIGFSIYDINDKAIGILVFLDDKAFSDEGNIIEALLPRACAELDRLKTQNKLTKLESDYHHLTDTTLDAIWEIDALGNLVNINTSCWGIYGYTQDHMTGRPYTDFMTKESADRFREHFSVLKQGENIYDVVSDHYSKEGIPIHVIYNIRPKHDEYGTFIGAAGTTKDISVSVRAHTVIKNNSELFSSILARLPVIFFRIDQNGYLVDIRGNGLKRMGVEDMDWVGKPGYGLFIGMDEKIDSALSGETVFFESRGKYEGVPWWFLTSMFFDNWSGFGAVGFSVDITEQKLFEEQLVDLLNNNRKLAQRLVEVQEDERRNLARELHDELGQSITAVKSLATVITASTGDEYTEIRSLGNSIIDLSGRLYEVVNNIMQRLRPDIIDGLRFDETIKNCIVRSQLETTGVSCDLSIIGNINDLDEVVKITVYRIVQECLTNISKYAMASNIRILIERSSDDANLRSDNNITTLQRAAFKDDTIKRDVVKIEIFDDGIGMNVSETLNNTIKNNRLGLQGMNERVTAIGGTLDITSKTGEGVKVQAVLYLGTDRSKDLSDSITTGVYDNGIIDTKRTTTIKPAKKSVLDKIKLY